MHRRTFLTASVLATTAAITHEQRALADDARSVGSESPFGATAAALPLPASEQLPLGPLDTHYPDKHSESLDKRFKGGVNNGALERVATGFRWAEGPAYLRAGRYLIFSDIPNNRLMRLLDDDNHLSVFRSPSFNANGNTLDHEGRLLSCEHGGRRIVRTEHDGTVTVLADRYDNKRFNSPNDIVVASNGSIWFTDPTYGISGSYEGLAAQPEQSKHNVFRIDAQSGGVSVVVDDFVQPNGICFSPDETKLYVIDSGIEAGVSHIRVFDVDIHRGTVRNSKVFVEGLAPGITDGMRADVEGNIWCSMGWGDPKEDGVRCYSPTGELLGKIHLPETCANLVFGGPLHNRLYMCASTSVYACYVGARGAANP